ncbi:hypothetical protein OC844_003888 [Tilletia horrida]|nr:hypothetical protein OC844_003888 [Tilletia horrida]
MMNSTAHGWLPDGMDASPSVSNVTLIPVFFLSALFFFPAWTRDAVAVRQALKRYDVQEAVLADAANEERPAVALAAAAAAAPTTTRSKSLSALRFVAETVAVLALAFSANLLLLAPHKDRSGLILAWEEHGLAVLGGAWLSLLPPFTFVGRRTQTGKMVFREKASGKKSVRFVGGTADTHVITCAKWGSTASSRTVAGCIIVLKAFAFGLATAKTGVLIPFVFFMHNNLFAMPSGRSLRTVVLGSVTWFGWVTGPLALPVVFVAVRYFGWRQEPQGLYNEVRWASDCPRDVIASGRAHEMCEVVVTEVVPPLKAQWLLAAMKAAIWSAAIAPILALLQVARNFDLMELDGLDAVEQDEALPTGEKSSSSSSSSDAVPSSSSTAHRDRNGKLPVLIHRDDDATRKVKLPLYNAALYAYTSYIIGQLAFASFHIGLMKSEVPALMRPIKIQDYLFDPNVKYRQLACNGLSYNALVFSAAATLAMIVAMSLQVYLQAGRRGLVRLWMATDPIWSRGPAVADTSEDLMALKSAKSEAVQVSEA